MAIFTNQATLSYNGGTTASNITTGEVLDALTMTKTAVGTVYADGGRVTYIINIRNTGAAITDATVTDDLGTFEAGGLNLRPLDYVNDSVLLYVNGAPATPPEVTTDPVLTFNGINIPAGGNLILIYETQVNEFARLSLGSAITNTAELSAGGIALSDSTTVNAEGDVKLSIAKAICPSVLNSDGTLTYTFIIQNLGNTEVVATDNLVVRDTFNPILNITDVTYNGDEWTEGVQYTYDEATGEFITAEGSITVPAATYTRDPVSGTVSKTPGVAVITVTGTI